MTAAVGGVAIAVGVLASGALGERVAADPVATSAIRATLDAFLWELVLQSALLVAIGILLLVLGSWRRPAEHVAIGTLSPS